MSVSLREVIEAGGYDLATIADAEWLIGQEKAFDDLLDEAKQLVDDEEERWSDEN